MNKMNKEWYLAHQMPKNPTLNQQINGMLITLVIVNAGSSSGKILEEIEKRGIQI